MVTLHLESSPPPVQLKINRNMDRIFLLIIVMILKCVMTSPDTSDVDTNSASETSDTADMEMDLDNNDPNLHNPISRHGYGGGPNDIPQPSPSPSKPFGKMQPRTTLPPKTIGEQTLQATLQLGIIVGVALMVGLGFMTMVGMELLCDKVCDEYRRLLKKPKPLPDVERLHPAELVGKFSRYK